MRRVREWKLLEAEREHQKDLATIFLKSLETIQATSAQESKANAEALIAVAKGMTAQAASFGEWMKCFQTTSAPTSTIIREEDEYRMEQERLEAQGLGLPDEMMDLPAEMRLAWALKHDRNLLE